MNRLLVTLIAIVAVSLLIVQSLGRTPSNFGVRGVVVALEGTVERIRGEHVFEAREGDRLRRGEIVKT